jgi:hypothetical protein
MSVNSSALRTKKRISQTAMPWSRVCALVSSGVCQPHVDADGDGCQHSRSADRVSGEVGEVPAQQRDRDLDGRVVQAAAYLANDEAHAEPDRDAPDDVHDEAAGRIGERESSGHDGGNCELVRDEGRTVVHEALALDQRDQAPRDPHALGDGGGGGRVGGRDDRAEDEGDGPAQIGDDVVRDGRDDEHRREDEPDGEEADRAGVLPQISQGGEKGGPVEERREHRDQDEVGRQLDRGNARYEAEDETAENEQDRIGDSAPLRRDQEDRDRQEQRDEGEAVVFGKGHRGRIATLD